MKTKKTPTEPPWKAIADRHASTNPGSGYSPSLVTGRCRCKACREARAAGYCPPLVK